MRHRMLFHAILVIVYSAGVPAFAVDPDGVYSLEAESGLDTWQGSFAVTSTLPFRTVALNPYWMFPSGAHSVSKAQVAREINKPGSTGNALSPAGGPLARGVSSDGVARVILGVRTLDTAHPVTFTILGTGLGKLARFSSTMFSNPAPGITGPLTIPPQGFLPIPGESAAKAVAVLFIAPETPRKSPVTVKIRIQQNGKISQIDLLLKPPPVLLVHGLWSSGSAWDGFLTNFGKAKFPFVGRVSYDGSLPFSSPLSRDLLRNRLANVLDETRRTGIVAAQVNVVGHSMGGLLTRRYMGVTRAGTLENFFAGDVNRLITLNTPHLGSKLAAFLWTRRNQVIPIRLVPPAVALCLFRLKDFTPKLGDIMAKCLGKPVTRAVWSLTPSITSGLVPPPSVAPYDAVGSLAPTGFVAEREVLDWAISSFNPRLDVDALLPGGNDLRVSLASQLNGGRSRRVFRELTHTQVLDSGLVANYVECALATPGACAPVIPLVEVPARPELASFTLEGRAQVSGSNIELSGVPFSGLQLNNRYAASVTSPTRGVEDFVYLYEDGAKTEMLEGDPTQPVHFSPTSFKPIRISVLAAFTDNTFAMRSWIFRIDPVGDE